MALHIEIDEKFQQDIALSALGRGQSIDDFVRDAVMGAVRKPEKRWQGESLIVIFEEMALAPGTVISASALFEKWLARHPTSSSESFRRGIAQLMRCGNIVVDAVDCENFTVT